jgi:hypothetical protein
MNTRDEHSDNNRQSEHRRTVERLRNAASQMQQSIVQTLAVIGETQRLIGLLEKMDHPVIRLDGKVNSEPGTSERE